MRTSVALALVLAAGCASLHDLAARAFERPTLAFLSADAEALDLEGVTLSLRYRVENPNAVGLSLARLGYRLEVEGRPLASGELPGGLRIPARGSAPLAVPVRLRFADLPAFVETLLARSEVTYRISGEVGLDTPVGVVQIPFEHAGRAPVPRPPGFAIESARLEPAGAGEVGLRLRIRMTNANAFPLPAGRLDYGLEVAGATVASGRTLLLAPVAPGASAALDLPVQLDLLGAGRALAAALAGQPVPIALRGSAGWGALRLPLGLAGQAGR